MRTAPAPTLGALMLRWWGTSLATAAMYLLGRRPAPVPPWWHPGLIPGWWEERGALLAGFGLLRGLLVGAGCYLVALWTAAIVAACLPRIEVIGALSRARLPGVRLVSRTTLGLTAAGAVWIASAQPGGAAAAAETSTTASGLTPPTPPGGPDPAPTLRYIGPPGAAGLHGAGPAGAASPRRAGLPGATSSSPAGSTSTAPVARIGAGTRRAPDSGGLGSRPVAAPRSSVGSPPAGQPPGPITPERGAPAPGRLAEIPGAATPPGPNRLPVRRAPEPVVGQEGSGRAWLVRPGDNLWSIAADTLAAAWGRPPELRELAPYWWQVVQTNRPHLPNPADPDLLFPGDRVTLPPPPARPAAGALGGSAAPAARIGPG